MKVTAAKQELIRLVSLFSIRLILGLNRVFFFLRMRTAQIRHALTDVIGSKHGIGVENLNGSAAIAGETARAYRETMTLSFVSGRTFVVSVDGHACLVFNQAVSHDKPRARDVVLALTGTISKNCLSLYCYIFLLFLSLS